MDNGSTTPIVSLPSTSPSTTTEFLQHRRSSNNDEPSSSSAPSSAHRGRPHQAESTTITTTNAMSEDASHQASESFAERRQLVCHGERPVSPGTLALMCDEKDPLLLNTTTAAAAAAPSSPAGREIVRLYGEQERAILSEFRDCLRRVISLGNRRG